MRLTVFLLRRQGTYSSAYRPAPDLISSLGKYTKSFANLPERYVIRKSTRLLRKSEDHRAFTAEIKLAPLREHMLERPWSEGYWSKVTSPLKYVRQPAVEPIREDDWMWFRGDRVEILKGPDKGKQGYINYVVQERNWVCVEGLNCDFETVGESSDFPGVMHKNEKPLLVTTDIKLVDPSDEAATDVEWRFTEDGTRVRVSKRTGHIIPFPTAEEETTDYKTKAGYKENKTKDTKAADVEKITYEPKLCTFDMDVAESMGIDLTKTPRKTYWY